MSDTFVTQAQPEPSAGPTRATARPATSSQPTAGQTTLAQATLESTSHAPLVDRTSERLAAGRSWARGQGVRAQAHIRAHPLRTTAYAVGAGVLTGMLLKGVRRRES